MIILCVVAIVVFLFSLNSPWLGDDLIYQYKITAGFNNVGGGIRETLPEDIDNVVDLIESQNLHYMTVNGRYAAHIVVQMFCGWWGQTAFSIINAIMYIAFVACLLALGGKSFRDTRSVLLTVILIFLVFIIKFVPSTQIGYIWTFTLALAYLKLLEFK